MYYLQVQIVILLYGLTHVYGFFHFRRENSLLEESVSFNKTILRSLPTFWIEQRVDHFNNSDQRTWKQKFYKIMNSWKPRGPILIYLNGEAPLILSRLEMTYYLDNSQSLIGQIVEKTGAAFFMLEHRYYGASQPFDEQTTENLAFLTSRQALADAANLLQTMKELSPELKNSKVIVVGCSYAGNLAAWMKLLYPLLIDAALSSSAPVLAQKDFKEYFEGVTVTFRTYGSQECVDEIYNKFNTFHLLLQSPEGIKKLKEENSICEDNDMTVPENKQLFFLSKISVYAYLAQYGTPNNISSSCQNLNLNEQEQTLPYIWSDQLDCYNYDFNEWVNSYSASERSWMYQTCTEFGYFQSTSSSKQMFGDSLPVDFYYKICRMVFGEEFNEKRVDQGVMNTNRMYKGLTPNVTNVVFVNGDMDPWHRLSILHDLSADAPAIYMKGSSHCHDDDKPDPSDTDDIKEARKRIINLIKKWIMDESEYNKNIY